MLRDDFDEMRAILEANGWRRTVVELIGMVAIAAVMFAFVTFGLMAVPA